MTQDTNEPSAASAGYAAATKETAMGKIYATTDDGRTVLIEIKCDSCGAKRKPGPDGEGWIVVGADNGIGTQKTHVYHCPKCSAGWA